MAAEVDMLARALADLNVVARSEFKLKPEQEVAVKSLLGGKDAFAVLPTGYGKSLIYQMFVRAKDCVKWGWLAYTTSTVRGICTFAVLCSVTRPFFWSFTRVYEGQFILCNKEEF